MNNIWRIIFAVIGICVLTCPSIALKSTYFPMYFLNADFSSSTTDKSNGAVIEQAVYNTQKRTSGGKTYIIASIKNTRTENSKKIYEKIDRYYVLNGGKVFTYNITMVSTKEGSTYQYSGKSFNWASGLLGIEFVDYSTGKQVSKTVPLKENLVDYQDLTFYMYDMVMNSVKNRNISLMFPDGGTVPIALSTDYSVVPVTLKEKQINCYRIGIKPDFGILSNLIPDSGYWFESDPPYRFVKYEGTLKGPGSPNVIIQEN